MLREIVLDTETTGLDPKKGDRLVEVGCVELVNRIPTSREFHRFINPLRDVPAEAQAIHGISTDFLRDKPVFAAIAAEFIDFIASDTLVIHNAAFDISFLNFELGLVSMPVIGMDRVVDTLQLARRKHPAGPNTLDGLCKRYGIDNTQRTKHGAIVDSLLLAEVYVELLGERQATLGLATAAASAQRLINQAARRAGAPKRPVPLPSPITDEADAAHRRFVETLGAKAVWRRYLGTTDAT
jgi:DNA polymerase III subunit epsilon